MKHTIISADYHRNGIGGEGFYVALVDSDDGDGPERFVVVDLSGDIADPDNFDPSRVAVLRVDQLAAGNIGMFPVTDPETGQVQPGTGGAAYRGADYWGGLREKIRAWVRESSAAAMRASEASR